MSLLEAPRVGAVPFVRDWDLETLETQKEVAAIVNRER